jgi:predicted esterase
MKRFLLLITTFVIFSWGRGVYCDADSDCFYAPFDSVKAGEYCPALIYLSCTGATPKDLDSIKDLADSLGMIFLSCHKSRNHRDVTENDRDIMRTYEKLLRDYPVDPARIFIYGFSGQAVQAMLEIFIHPKDFRGIVAVCSHAGVLPLAKWSELGGKLIFLISRNEDWNLKDNQEMHRQFVANGVTDTLAVAPGPHGPPDHQELSGALRWLRDNSR